MEFSLRVFEERVILFVGVMDDVEGVRGGEEVEVCGWMVIVGGGGGE